MGAKNVFYSPVAISIMVSSLCFSILVTATVSGLEEDQYPPIITDVVEGKGYVLIEWELPNDTNTTDLQGFRIYRAPEGSSLEPLKLEGSSKRSFNDTTMLDGTSYDYSVAALYGDDPEEILSETVRATPGGPPSPPRMLNAFLEGGSINLTWEPPVENGGFPVQFYIIQRKSDNGTFENLATRPADFTYYTDLSVEVGGTYGYRIIAVNEKGASDPGDPASLNIPIPIEPPSPPLDLRASSGYLFIHIRWSAPENKGDGLTGYKIYRIREDGPSERIATLEPSILEYNDTVIDPNTNYTYSVVALDQFSQSDPSDNLTIVVITESEQPEQSTEEEDDQYGTRNAFLLGGAVAIILIAGAIIFYLRMTRSVDEEELEEDSPADLRPGDNPPEEEVESGSL
jgi:hypothetical protein